MQHLIDLLLAGFTTAIIGNVVLNQFLGICPFLGVSKKLDTAFGMGLAVTFVTVVAGLLSWLVTAYVLKPGAPLANLVWRLATGDANAVGDLSMLAYLIYIIVIAGAVQVVEMYLRKFFPPLYKSFGVFLPLITTNCVILFVCVKIQLGLGLADPWSLDYALVYALAAGVGFTIALLVMAGIREELELMDVPAPLRGSGIALIVAGILALGFMGFTGVGDTLQRLLSAGGHG